MSSREGGGFFIYEEMEGNGGQYTYLSLDRRMKAGTWRLRYGLGDGWHRITCLTLLRVGLGWVCICSHATEVPTSYWAGRSCLRLRAVVDTRWATFLCRRKTLYWWV